MTIQAIETRYKGYRFRSRLEARWAVAFDAMGWKWQYEPEGYIVDGQHYLPDFFIENLNGFLEIKAAHVAEKKRGDPRIYFAGKMGKQGDWRGWRPFDLPNLSTFEERTILTPVQWEGYRFGYTGPYGDEMCNHSEAHGLDCGVDNRDVIFKRSHDGLTVATCVLALLDTKDAYGTLVEIGIASQVGIPVYVAEVGCTILGEPDDEYYNKSPGLSDWYTDDMWFAKEAATEAKAFYTHDEAIRWLLDKAGARPVETPEQTLIRRLGEMTGRRSSVVYGTPGEHKVTGSLALRVDERAIERARSARFEHGEKG
jgi:nucleoside 2-deoxyribosyltransferase